MPIPSSTIQSGGAGFARRPRSCSTCRCTCFEFTFDNVRGVEVRTVNDAEKQVETGRATVMHVRCLDRLPEETYRHVLELLAGLSPVVQARPPSAALVELKG